VGSRPIHTLGWHVGRTERGPSLAWLSRSSGLEPPQLFEEADLPLPVVPLAHCGRGVPDHHDRHYGRVEDHNAEQYQYEEVHGAFRLGLLTEFAPPPHE